MAIFGEEKIYGLTAAPYFNLRMAQFTSVLLGYSSNSSVTTNAEVPQVGYLDTVTGYFEETFIRVSVTPADIAGARIRLAEMWMNIVAHTLPGGWVADLEAALHVVRATIDITDVSGQYADASATLTWTDNEYGGKPGVDYDSVALTTLLYEYDSDQQVTPDTADPTVKRLVVTAAIQELADEEGSYRDFVLRPLWAKTVGVNGPRIQFDDPTQISTGPNSHLRVWYVPELAGYGGRDSDATLIDKAKYKSVILTDRDAHIWVGNVRAGSSGSPVITHVANETESDIPTVVVVSEAAQAGPVRQSAIGTKQLRTVRVYDVATNQGTASGTLTIERGTVDTAKWKASFTPAFSETPVVLEDSGGAGATEFSFAVDVDLYNGATKIATIFDDWWDGGTTAAGWEIEVELFGDIRVTTEDAEAPERILLSNYFGAFDQAETDDLATPWTAKARRLSDSTVYQIRTTAYNATYLGNSRTHIEIGGDAGGGFLVAGKSVTLFRADMAKVRHAVIEAVLDHTGSPADTIVLNEAIGTPGDYVAGSGVASGLLLGNLLAPRRARLVAGSLGEDHFTIDSAAHFADLNGDVRILEVSGDNAGQGQISPFARSGLTINLQDDETLALTYTAGAEVEVDETPSDGYVGGVYAGTASYAPFYAQLAPEADADRGRQAAKVRWYSWTPR